MNDQNTEILEKVRELIANNTTAQVAEAVAAERERCAKLAESWGRSKFDIDKLPMDRDLALEICQIVAEGVATAIAAKIREETPTVTQAQPRKACRSTPDLDGCVCGMGLPCKLHEARVSQSMLHLSVIKTLEALGPLLNSKSKPKESGDRFAFSVGCAVESASLPSTDFPPDASLPCARKR